jgi:hypothetical protein
MKFATTAALVLVALFAEVDAVTLENQVHARGLKTLHRVQPNRLAQEQKPDWAALAKKGKAAMDAANGAA